MNKTYTTEFFVSIIRRVLESSIVLGLLFISSALPLRGYASAIQYIAAHPGESFTINPPWVRYDGCPFGTNYSEDMSEFHTDLNGTITQLLGVSGDW